MATKNLLGQVLAGPCNPVYICNDGIDNAIPVEVVGTVDVAVIGDVSLNNNIENLVSNPDGTDQVLAITTTADSYSGFGGTLDANTTHVKLRFEISTIRMTASGTTPTLGTVPPGIGIEYHSNDLEWFTVETISISQFISNIASVTGYIQVQEYMVV